MKQNILFWGPEEEDEDDDLEDEDPEIWWPDNDD